MGLKEKRLEKGMTLKELAAASGVHYMKIYQIETGTVSYTHLTLPTIYSV